jgi:hypothetical protein
MNTLFQTSTNRPQSHVPGRHPASPRWQATPVVSTKISVSGPQGPSGPSADLVNVGGSQALLAIGEPPAGGVGSAEQVRQERMHAGGGEQHRGITVGDEGGARDDDVTALGEERQEHRP